MASTSILIYVDSLKRAKFFKAFEPYFEEFNIKYKYLTNKLSVVPLLKGNILFLKRKRGIRKDIDYSFLSKSLSILNGYHDMECAKEIASSVWDTLEEHRFDTVWIWNGTTTIERSLAAFARNRTLKTLFFEIANIENRVFIDPWGMAGESFLYAHPEILDRYEVDEQEFLAWREAYKRSKEASKGRLKSSIPWHNIFDYMGYFLGLVQEDYRSVWKLVAQRIHNRFTPLPVQEPEFDKKYIFVPLQVSNDSQVKLYSRFDNRALIDKALEYAKEDILVYIKPHPAEDNFEEIERLKTYSDHPLVRFVNGNIFELLLNAQKVVVNTSTVGLEAKIFDKDTIVLGDAYYKNFDRKRVRAFIQHYLPKMRYFPANVDRDDFMRLEIV